MTAKQHFADHVHYFNYQTGRPRFHFDENAAGAGADAGAADKDKEAAAGADADKGAADKGTILDGADKGGADDKGADKGADAPDWRVQMAGGDAEAAKRLARFTDPAMVYKSLRSLETKLSSGEYKKPLAENATAEEKATWPEGLASAVLAGRDPNGRKLGDNPAFIRQLASLALELNPAATLVPAGTTDPGKNVQARIAEIRGISRNEPDKYNGDKAMQAELRELIEADLKMQKRGTRAA